ncbi:hypothetical protein RLL94_00360, partial [Streptococcus pneumoniae]|nr:hypothetical protein [Streptococcus pneumoniae]
TFIQTKKNGKQRVFNVDPYNVTEKEALDLQQVLREGNLKMITSYAAAPDQKEAKEFTYEVLYKEDKSKGKSKGKGNNKK